MTIDEFISKRHTVRKNLPANVLGNIDEIIKSVLLDSGITMRVIGTDYVFPRILQTREGEKTIIWDQTYWELFRYFLLYLADLKAEQKGSNIVFHADRSCFNHPKILIPFSYFLALIVKDQPLAINFAKYYNQRCHEAQVIRLEISIDNISEYIEIAKLYIAVHEQMHFGYKHDSQKRKDDIAGFKQLLDIAYKLVENLDDNFCKDKYLKRKSELLEMVGTAYSDIRMQEEVLCDTYAFNNCLFVYRQYWANKYTQKEIVTKCLEAIRIIEYYNSTLISLKIFWEDCSCNINAINAFQKATAHRSYLSEIIAMIQLTHQELHDYAVTSLYKFDGFEDNYSLENIIYSYFLHEDSISFWRNSKVLSKEGKSNNIDKFELLDWRIN